MGATLSNLTEGVNGLTMGPGLGDIPESCVACVFMYLTPMEICNLARLNRAFRGAASSDAVWEAKLPPNYKDLLALLPPERYQSLSKKDIFALLSRPIPFDDGNREVWVDKVTSRVCMSISAKAMLITGIEDRRYWNWISTEESRYLQQQGSLTEGARGSYHFFNTNFYHKLKEAVSRKYFQVILGVGFGISKPEHVKQIAGWGAASVIVGSAAVKILGEAKSLEEGLKPMASL